MKDRKTGIGVTLILAGTILLLYKLNILFLPWYIFTWPSLLILIGFVLIVTKERWEGGIILITIGGAFLLPKIFDLSIREIWTFWPVLLIILGVTILVRHFDENNKNKQKSINDEFSNQ